MSLSKRKTPAEKLIAKAVDAAVGRALEGHSIPIMSIEKVYTRAWTLVGNGHTEAHLAAGLDLYVSQIEVKV